MQQEGVVASLSNSLQAIFSAGYLKQLDHFDLVGFSPGLMCHDSISRLMNESGISQRWVPI
jgi:hypothetical protein